MKGCVEDCMGYEYELLWILGENSGGIPFLCLTSIIPCMFLADISERCV